MHSPSAPSQSPPGRQVTLMFPVVGSKLKPESQIRATVIPGLGLLLLREPCTGNGSAGQASVVERERERERKTNRQTERDRETKTETEGDREGERDACEVEFLKVAILLYVHVY